MRDQDQVVLDAIAGKRPSAAGFVRANCPFCEDAVQKVDRKQCLSLELSTGWWKCFRCDTRGKLDEVPFDTMSLAQKPKEEKLPVNLPEGFTPLWTPDGKRALALQRARKYLASRIGVTDRVVELARIGACVKGPFAGRVVVPIYKAGKLAGYVGRTWNKKSELKYRYSEGFERATTLYNEEALYVTTDAPAIIVEGVFDTFPFWRDGEQLTDGVAVLGKPSVSQFSMFTAARRPLLVVFDGDAHREATALAMHLRLAGKTAAALKLPPGFDPDELHLEVKQRARSIFAAA